MVQADVSGMLPTPCCRGLNSHQGWLWPANCQSVFVQEGLSFCFYVFGCYSMPLLNAFQCANIGDVGIGLGAGGRKV